MASALPSGHFKAMRYPRLLLLFALGWASVLNLARADSAAAKFVLLHDIFEKQAEKTKPGSNGSRAGENPGYYLVSFVAHAQSDY